MNRGDLITRFDAFYHNPYFCLLEKQLSEVQHPIISLRKISDSFTNGDHGGVKYVDKGVRYLRGQSVTEEGLNLKDELYISTNDHERMIRAEVIPGDVLLTIAGSIGNCCVVEGVEKANINQAIVKIRPSPSTIDPNFLSFFLNSKYGKFQTSRLANGAVQLNVNFSEAGDIKIIVPSLPEQYRLVTAMDEARSQRKQKLAEADALLSSLDDYLLKILGLEPPVKDERKVFAISLQDVKSQGRLNSDYFHPERILALRAMITAAETINCEKLESIVDFVREKIKKPSENYLGLAHVQSNTGELTNVDDMATGDCFTFQTDDVLFARLRPYLNKVYCAEIDGCCSPEFHVLRIYDKNSILPNYLAVILRSRLILAQTIHMMTGNTHPRLTNDDVTNLLIPIPKLETQEKIAQEVKRRKSEAQRLRSEAETGWQAAKQWFEDQLLGGS